jgi:hypothetical protein
MAVCVAERTERAAQNIKLTNFELSLNPLTVSRAILLFYLLIVLQSFDEF